MKKVIHFCKNHPFWLLSICLTVAISLFGCGGGGGGFINNDDGEQIASRFQTFTRDMENLSANIGRNFASGYYNNCFYGNDVVELVNDLRAVDGWVDFHEVRVNSVRVDGNSAEAEVFFSATVGQPGYEPITDSVTEIQHFTKEGGTWLMLGNQGCRGSAKGRSLISEKTKEYLGSAL